MKSISTKLFVALVYGLGIAGAHAADPAPASINVTTGEMKTTFGALLQSWSIADTKTADTGVNFRLRRAELKAQANISDEFRWFVMVDPAKSLRTGAISSSNDNKILQDLGIGFALTPEIEVTAGQFKTPTTAEGLESSGKLLFPERSYGGRTFGDRREAGLMLGYKLADLQLRGMISNGQGPNVETPTATTKKDLSFRADYTVNDDVQVGTFTTAGSVNYSQKGRWGMNVRAELGKALAKAEAIRHHDSGVVANSVNVEGAYELNERLMPALRFATTSNGTFTGTETSAAVNYSVFKNGRVQLGYSYLRNMLGNSGSPTLTGANGARSNVLNLAFQASL